MFKATALFCGEDKKQAMVRQKFVKVKCYLMYVELNTFINSISLYFEALQKPILWSTLCLIECTPILMQCA